MGTCSAPARTVAATDEQHERPRDGGARFLHPGNAETLGQGAELVMVGVLPSASPVHRPCWRAPTPRAESRNNPSNGDFVDAANTWRHALRPTLGGVSPRGRAALHHPVIHRRGSIGGRTFRYCQRRRRPRYGHRPIPRLVPLRLRRRTQGPNSRSSVAPRRSPGWSPARGAGPGWRRLRLHVEGFGD